MMTPSFTITPNNITVVYGGSPHVVNAKDSPNYAKLREALLNGNWDKIPKYLSIAKTIETWSDGEFVVENKKIKCGGEDVPKSLSERILKMISDGKDTTYLKRFWRRLRENPSWRSVEQLFAFLQHGGIPIDENGFILAYKAVKPDYKDYHSGSVDNHPGATNSMPRRLISDDPNVACHFGYHVGALAYANNFGDNNRRIIICKIDPADVICVPYDNSQQKMRVSKYEVVGNYGAKLSSSTHEHVKTKPSNPRKTKFDKLDEVDLLKLDIDTLRKYAANDLKIVGASKIPGGKRTLVHAILEVRRG